ncbi:flagellar basal body rod protein FlgF [Halomonas mongoliensis]|uniref:flagellar basal body rod protein FlgF n=1 Tax=Halomonas mongoliensis TaxID=321265 RepID=UPI00403B064C
MDRILYTAMSGASQSLKQQEVVSHNLANVDTPGFRAQLHAMRAVPVQGEAAHATRASVVASTPGADFTPGPLMSTERPLDIAVDERGWIAVQAPDGTEAYTRRGDLQIDAAGMLTVIGRPVMGEGGPIILPLEAQVSIGADGTLSAIAPGQGPEALVEAGRIKLVEAGNGALQRGDDGLFRAPANEEGVVPVLPQAEGVRLVSGVLEGSNVSPVEAMVSMIDVARRYDMQMKVISTADENAKRANSLLSIQG